MIKISPIKKIIITSAIFGLMILILVIFVIIPLLKDINKMSGNIIEVKKDLIFFEKELEIAKRFEGIYGDLKITPEKIDSLLVDASVPIELISFLEDMGKQQELSIKILPISGSKKADYPFDSMNFKIEINGHFLNVMRFLEKLETSPYFILTKSFYVREAVSRELVSGQYVSPSPGQVFSTIEVKVYVK